MEAIDGIVTSVMFRQIDSSLKQFSELGVWAGEGSTDAAPGVSLPTFSCTPLEYITTIGEYLLVLPQHLEVFAPQDKEGEAELFVHKWVSRVARMCADKYISLVISHTRACQLSCNVLHAV